MGKTPEQRLKGLEAPSDLEVKGLAQRNRKTSTLLDTVIENAFDGCTTPKIDIPLNHDIDTIYPFIPRELAAFLDAFRPQATSMNYRLEFSRRYPQLSLIIARGMEDVASVQIWNKTQEIGVLIENNWSHIQHIGDAQNTLKSMLQKGNAYQKRVNHLNMGQRIIFLAICAVREPSVTSSPTSST